MSKDRRPFIIAESILGVLVLIMIGIMFFGRAEHKKVAVILNHAESDQWSGFIYGVKQAAADEGLDVVFTSTDIIHDAEEERALIAQELADGADALIIEPAPGKNTLAMIEQEARASVPTILVKSTGGDSDLSAITPDNYGMGQALGQMVLDDYSGNISGKTIGIINQNTDTEAAREREEGLYSVLGESGCEIIWYLHGLDEMENPSGVIQDQEKADFVIALDTTDLELAGELEKDRDIHGAIVYGIGSSTQSVYYLDFGHVEGLIFPNYLDMGYQSVMELSTKLSLRTYRMKNKDVSFRTLKRDDLFLEENNDIWFMLDR